MRGSHWGRGTGYTYTTERLGFLNKIAATERQTAMHAAMQRQNGSWMPFGNRRALPPLDPLPSPVKRDDMSTSFALRERADHYASRRLLQSTPRAQTAMSATFDGQATVSQLAFQRPESRFLRTFGADRNNGKLRDTTSEFREQIYTKWNVSGARSPELP